MLDFYIFGGSRELEHQDNLETITVYLEEASRMVYFILDLFHIE